MVFFYHPSFIKIVLASELMNLIYEAVEILGGIAVTVLLVSYISHRIKKAKEPKVYETKIDKEKELKMILKDEKRNKEIVKGALTTKDDKSKKRKTHVKTNHSSSKSAHTHRDKEIKSPNKRKRTASHSSSSREKSRAKEIRIPKQKRKLPGRDTRIKILNKLSNTQSELKPAEENKEEKPQKKFYDIQDSE